MNLSIRAVLSQADMFSELTETQLGLVATLCEAVRYQRGQVLLRENERTDEMYVIGRGAVEVLVNPETVSAASNRRGRFQQAEPVVLTELHQGQVFGEVSLVDQGIRSATIRVSQDNTFLLRIPRSQLMQLCDTYPVLGYRLMRNLAAELAVKIRNTDWLVRQYQLQLADKG
jgi:CRP-like cAMP-binding protein